MHIRFHTCSIHHYYYSITCIPYILYSQTQRYAKKSHHCRKGSRSEILKSLKGVVTSAGATFSAQSPSFSDHDNHTIRHYIRIVPSSVRCIAVEPRHGAHSHLPSTRPSIPRIPTQICGVVKGSNETSRRTQRLCRYSPDPRSINKTLSTSHLGNASRIS